MELIKKRPKTVSIKRSEFVSVKKKQNLLTRKMEEMQDCLALLAKINFNLSIREVQIIGVILSAAGVLVGLLLHNVYVAVMLMITFPILGWEYLIIKKGSVENFIDSQVIKYAELIKNSYMTTNNIMDSIRNNMRRFDEPIKSVFSEFVDEVDIYNYSIKDAFNRMNQKLESTSLKEFTDQLVYCDNDRRFINSLEVTVQHLNDKREFMQRWEFTKKDIMNKYTFMLLLVNGMTLFMLLGYGDISAVFLSSYWSKPLIAIYILIQIIVTIMVLRKVNKLKI